MNTAILLVPPIINVIVTGLFAGVVLSQYARRHRIYQLYWAIALLMAFVATLAYLAMIAVQPTSGAGILFFRIYYILGGALTPAWLGMGSVALVFSARTTRICLGILSLISLIAITFILDAGINLAQIRQVVGTPGTGVLQTGPWLVPLILLNTLGVVALAGISIYSGWKLVRRQPDIAGLRTSNVLWANLLILIGALLDGAAGSLARFFGVENVFWLVMALGWVILFIGVLLASRRSRATRQAAQPVAQPEQKAEERQGQAPSLH
jgi:hypothetical protein